MSCARPVPSRSWLVESVNQSWGQQVRVRRDWRGAYNSYRNPANWAFWYCVWKPVCCEWDREWVNEDMACFSISDFERLCCLVFWQFACLSPCWVNCRIRSCRKLGFIWNSSRREHTHRILQTLGRLSRQNAPSRTDTGNHRLQGTLGSIFRSTHTYTHKVWNGSIGPLLTGN